ATVADDAVVAATAAQNVVALAADDQVRPVRACDRVVAGAAVDRQQGERPDAVLRRERIVAAKAVHLQALGGRVERELPEAGGLELDAAGIWGDGEHVAERWR